MVSSTPPSGTPAIAAAARKTLSISRIALAYYTFVPSVDIQLASFPSFTVSYPTSLFAAGATIKEAFLDAGTAQPVFSYDIAFGASGATFTSTVSTPKLRAGGGQTVTAQLISVNPYVKTQVVAGTNVLKRTSQQIAPSKSSRSPAHR